LKKGTPGTGRERNEKTSQIAREKEGNLEIIVLMEKCNEQKPRQCERGGEKRGIWEAYRKGRRHKKMVR